MEILLDENNVLQEAISTILLVDAYMTLDAMENRKYQ
jgi:hypothetical protein